MRVAIALIVGVFFSIAVQVPAAVIGVEAVAEPTSLVEGEPITYVIRVETNDYNEQPKVTAPDFGGLQIDGGPDLGHQTFNINGRVRITLQYAYRLSASKPGDYVIGEAKVESGGQAMATEPITVRVMKDALDALPPSLQTEPILNPKSGDPNINRQLKGKMFVRPRLSKSEPFIGEPVMLTLLLYVDPGIARAIRNWGNIVPTTQSLLADEVPLPKDQFQFRPETIDGITYSVLPFYQAALTPSEPGEMEVKDYGARIQLRVQTGSLFDNIINVDAMAGAMKLYVRPLPEKGRDPAFSGTVGDYTLDSLADRDTASQDDIITLSVKISGSGNIAQAAEPQFPAGSDFEIFDQTQKTEKVVGSDGIRGSKTVEFLLRPTRSGTVKIPELSYITFDPKTESYRTLRSPARELTITPGKLPVNGAAPIAGTAPAANAEGERLRYIEPMLDVDRKRPFPLIENPLYWLMQMGAAGGAAWVFARSRRREAMDPREIRRRNARPALQKKLAELQHTSSSRDPQTTASALERALREYAADLRGTSADGATADEIEQWLRVEQIAETSARRIAEIIQSCAAVQYAPPGLIASNLAAWIEESRTLLLTESSS